MDLIVGFKLDCQDNDTYMFSADEAETCPVCKYRRDLLIHNPNYVLKTHKADLSATYDGFLIASEAFRLFCLREGYKDLVFGEFLRDRAHHSFNVTRQLQFDAQRRGTRFEKLCDQCGNYESVIGASPSYFLIDQPLADGFYRSDLFLGSGNEKHPLIIVATETKQKLQKAGLKGLEFERAFGLSPASAEGP